MREWWRNVYPGMPDEPDPRWMGAYYPTREAAIVGAMGQKQLYRVRFKLKPGVASWVVDA